MKRPHDDLEDNPTDIPAKRVKLPVDGPTTGEQHSQSPVATRKDEEFWFDDGTITLIAGDVEFRVYRGVLIEQSEVFRDLFSLAQPEIAEDNSPESEVRPYHPVLRLDDSPYALRHVLRACMPVKDRSFFRAQTPSFEAIRACIYLGDKYQMTRLHDAALEFLEEHFTMNFEEWDKLESWVPAGWEHHEAIGVVNIARSRSYRTILPTALLACATLGGSLVQGFVREDGEKETLSARDLELCFEAKERLLCATLSSKLLVLNPILTQDRYLRSSCRCVQDNRGLLAGVAKKIASGMAQSDPFAPFAELFDGETSDICSSCERSLRKRDEVERERLWANLPKLLGIEDVPGWGERHADRRIIPEEDK
ncbi:hypothetical protein L226DRAFT_572931 [Lentinus tigrinus ALCF2SS1-7]|uniref:Uncharacterized protein n=1 Tax=Lentinus tigrinus ALCF2SS1-6 TaxID=1328759 RepID=A0A5C2S4F6_9APHY|nr:hypothetical protein L227DRAFT_179777 [Lentinus tigrinus ALCF2SS1-6]RPD72835.1 hypothetical protein L226DRAFT_572931 [Lentinus tigrinus ALCF2SS1-7]